LTQGEGAESFETAYLRLFPRAATLAFRMLGDRSASEDVAAEALARTYANWAKVSTLPHRDGWVLRVTTNLVIDAARRRPPTTAGHDVVDPEDATALRLALLVALRSLSKRQRQAVALRYLSGMREDEVATALGVSPGTARTHVERGLAALRRHLGEAFREDGLADGRL
jgi:RNA polymerase sigma factor (sigma-70 family)